MAVNAKLADGRILTFPDGTDPSVIQATVKRVIGGDTAKERSWGEAATDIGAGVVSGIGSLVQLPGQLYGLATGNFEDTGTLGAGNAIAKYGEEMKSPGLKAREAASEAKVTEAEKNGELSAFATRFMETVKDPAQLSNFLAATVPQLIIPGGVAKMAAAKVFASTLEKGIASGLSQEAAKEIAQKAAIAAGTGAAKGAGSVMQGADIGAGAYKAVYDRMIEQGTPKEEAAAESIRQARTAGLSAAGVSFLAQSLPGASALEAKFAGKAGAGRLATGAGEAYSEIAEEVPGKMLQNYAVQQVDPTQRIMQGTGSVGAQAGIGGLGMGTVVGGAAHTPPAATQPVTLPAAPEAPAAPAELSALPIPALITTQQELQKLIAAGDRSPGLKQKLAEVKQELQARSVTDVAARAEALTAARQEREAAAAEAAYQRTEVPATEAYKADTTNMEQVGFREAEPTGTLPPQLDLQGNPVVAPMQQTEGLNTVAEAELPLTSDVLQSAGIAPTRRELEAAGQQQLDLRKTPAGQPVSPLKAVAPAPVAPAQAPVVNQAPSEVITAKDIKQFGTMSKTNREALSDLVEGKTQAEVLSLSVASPVLFTEAPKGIQKALGEILDNAKTEQRNAASLQAEPNVQPTTPPTIQAEPIVGAGRGKPSVAVPVQPAGTEPVVAPAAPAASTALPPETVGRGLVSPEQPAVAGVAPKVGVQPALDEEAQRKKDAAEVVAAFAAVQEKQRVEREARAKAEAAPAVAPVAPAKTAPTPKAESTIIKREAAPAPVPAVKSPFDITGPSLTGEVRKAETEAESKAEKQAKIVARQTAQKKVTPVKAAPAPAKVEVAPEVKKAQAKIDQKIEDLSMDADATKGQVKTVTKAAHKAGLIDNNTVAEVERLSKDRDMTHEDLLDELRAGLESGPTPVKAEAPVPAPTRAVLSKVKLTEPEVKKLEDHYGLGRTSDGFWSKIQDDVVALTNQGLKAVDVAIRRIIQKLSAGVLATAVIFSPAGLRTNFDFNLPQTYKTTTTVQVKADVPANAKAKMSVLAQSVYESMAPTAKASGKGFIIADKPNGMIHVFMPNGSMLVQDAALYGKDSGDIVGAVSSLVGGKKITPAGAFTLGATSDAEYAGGVRLDLRETQTEDGVMALHAAWLGDAKENRQARLTSTSAADNKISYGCINTGHETFLNSILPNIDTLNGGMIFVLPDEQAATEAMFQAKEETTTVEGVEQTAKGEAGRELVAKEAERPPEAAKAKIGEAPSKGRASTSEAVEPGQSIGSLRGEILRGKGVLYAALRRAINSGKVVLESSHPDGGIGGYYDGQKVTLYAEGIPTGQALAVALHEVGAHMGFKNLFGERVYNNVIKQIQDAASSTVSSADRTLARAAMNRIPESDKARGAEVYGDETLAYFIEEAVKAQNAGTLPTTGPIRAAFNNIKLTMLAAINRVFGSKLGIADLTTQDILAMAEGAFVRESFTRVKPATQSEVKQMFSVSATVKDLVNGAGVLDPVHKKGLARMIEGFQANPDVDTTTKFRTRTADIAATIENRLSAQFDGAVRDSVGNVNPMGLYRQAQDYTKMLLEFFQKGAISKDPVTKLWSVISNPAVRPPVEVFDKLTAWGKKNDMDLEQATKTASRILEGVRLDALREANRFGAGFVLHKIDPTSALSINQQIDAMVTEYNRNPELKEMSALMNEARRALVDHMISVGRLTKEQGELWRDVAGYVPFDRVTPAALEELSKTKRRTGSTGLAQLGKLPELVGSVSRPVGNVFENYLDTMGWMVGQVMKTDAVASTLRALEKNGHAEYLGHSTKNHPNAVGTYVKGDMMYWGLPSKYDVMAFMDLNGAKPAWLVQMGAFSNFLRTTITALPPFALKQVTDDVQRAILTSGVKNPGALLRMALTNFGSLAWAELRGIQHPTVKEFGELGLTGEFDFNTGKPSASMLKDLGYKPRGRFEKLMHKLEGITRASDLAVRKAVYDQTLKESNGDFLLAQTRARELINFRRRGSSEFVGAMVTTIPFFNAYIQGMDVLYRAASGKDSSASVTRAQARKLFWNRAAVVIALSTMYALGKDDDDEDYKNMDLRTRDNNWIIGGAKLSVPGELGILFKAIPERVVEYMKRSGTPEEQTAFEAVRTGISAIMETYVTRVVPIPQAVKPLLEAWTNYSFLTGRPLEGFHQQQLDKSERMSENTSELAKAIAGFSRDSVGVQVSPIMIDNALRGYFGSTAAIGTAMTDSLLNPTRVDRPLHKLALIGNYTFDPIGGRLMTEFYEARDASGKASATLKDLEKTDMDRAAAYAEAHMDELVFEKAINGTMRQLSATRQYRAFLNGPDAAKEMSATERETELNEIKKMEIGLVGWLREAKTAYRNN